MPLQIIFVTSLSNKCYSYHLWLLVITKSGKKEKQAGFYPAEISSRRFLLKIEL